MIDLLLVAFGAVSAIGAASIFAYDCGRRSSGVFRVYRDRPLTYAQFDPAMSESEMVEFLGGLAVHIRANGPAKNGSPDPSQSLPSLRDDEESRRDFYASTLSTGGVWPEGDAGSLHQNGSWK
ncbi:hypothetical protein [Metapseudomonas otitidis]|uniref:hypothetical protein n=1 Tax=Metapseudomonas otitidis TaxID=319939 RepID=UPI00209B70CB|nr:hypothetical protein [Pseudomonas otitidis]MCO7557805.1 hypothetical protein [Pseudomonas otitidis]